MLFLGIPFSNKAKNLKKKKNMVLPSSGIFEFKYLYLGQSVCKYFFFNYIFKEHPKVPNLGAFSAFFKTPNLTKIGRNSQFCFFFFFFFFLNFIFEMCQWLRATQFFFSLGLNHFKGLNLFILYSLTCSTISALDHFSLVTSKI